MSGSAPLVRVRVRVLEFDQAIDERLVVGAEQPINPTDAIINDVNKSNILIFSLLLRWENIAIKKDWRKGRPSLARTHKYCAIIY